MPHFSCCGISFEDEPTFVEHRQQIHGEQVKIKHTCCGIKFYTDEGFSEHRQQIHGEEKPGKRGFLARIFRRP